MAQAHRGTPFFSYIKYITEIITLKIQSMKSDVKRKIYLKKHLLHLKKCVYVHV